MFSSDNGPNRDANIHDADWLTRIPSKMVLSKSFVQENGVRQNLFVRWKGTYAPAAVSSVSSVTDIFPTMLELAGAPGQQFSSGASLVPLLEQRADDWFASRYVYNYRSNQQFGAQTFELVNGTVDKTLPIFDFNVRLAAVRQGDYKLSVGTLYDLKAEHCIEEVAYESDEVETALNEEQVRWWNDDILASPLSFVRPEVQVCYENERSSFFYSYMAVEQNGLEILNHDVTGWDAVGDSLTFHLRVHCRGNYALRFVLRLEDGCTAVLKLSVAGTSVTQEVKPGILNTNFPPVALEEGPAQITVGLQDVTLASGVTSVFAQATRLFLTLE